MADKSKSLPRVSIDSHESRPYVVMQSAGSIIGAGLFVGIREAISAAGPSVLITFLVIGFISIMVNLFLIEMSLANPAGASFSQLVSFFGGPLAGKIIGLAYIPSMVIGPASEIVAAGIIINRWLPDIPLFLLCIFIGLVVVLASLIRPEKLQFFFFSMAFLKIFTLLCFSLLGIAFISNFFPALFPVVDPVVFSTRSNFLFFSGWKGVMSASVAVSMIYGGTESIGLFADDNARSTAALPAARLSIVFRITFIDCFAAIVLICILPSQYNFFLVSPFSTAINIITQNPYIVNLFDAVIAMAAISLSISSIYMTGRMLYLQIDPNIQKMLSRRFPSRNKFFPANIFTWFLLFVSLFPTIFWGGGSYSHLFLFSGFGFLFMWLMITFSYCKYRKQNGPEASPNTWHLRAGEYLSYLVIILIGIGLICFFTTAQGMRTLAEAFVLVPFCWLVHHIWLKWAVHISH